MNLRKIYYSIFDHPQLPLIILFGFILGIANPFFDFPLAFTIGDEFEAQRVAFEIFNSFNLKHYSSYLPGWTWLQIPFLGLAIFILRLFHYSSIQAIKEQIILNSPGLFLFVPRILSALISSLSLIWVYQIGKKIESKKFGILLTLIYSLDFIRVHQSHFGRNYSAYLFSILGMLYYLIAFTKKPNLKTIQLSYFFYILAILFYPTAIVLAPIYLLIYFFHPQFFNKIRIKKLISSLILGILTIILLIYLTPGVIQSYFHQAKSFLGLSIFDKIIYYPKILFTYNPTIFILGLYGIFHFSKSDKKNATLILSFCLLLFTPFLSKDTLEPRYALSLSILLTVSFVYYLIKLKNYRTIAILTMIYSLLLNLRFIQLLYKPSTYITAKNYLEENIPSQSPILVDRNNFYLLPTKLAQQPKSLYNNSFYQNLNQIVDNLNDQQEVRIKNLKHITSLSNFTTLSDDKPWPIPQAQDYDYVVVEYFSPEERQTYLRKIDFNSSQFQLITTINPAKIPTQNLKLNTVLNIENPITYLFSVNQLGPYFEIYQKINKGD
jgi:hypothetical protein